MTSLFKSRLPEASTASKIVYGLAIAALLASVSEEKPSAADEETNHRLKVLVSGVAGL